jgi:hypothetical protein
MTSWGPLFALAVVILASISSVLLFARQQLGYLRLICGLVAVGLFEWICLFALSGFGWGWPDPSSHAIVIGQMLIGSSLGVAGAMLAWIVSRQLRWGISIAMIVLGALIFLPDSSKFAGEQAVVSAILIFLAEAYWFRTTQRLPG